VIFWLIFVLLLGLTLSPKMLSPIKATHIDKVYHLVAFAGFAFTLRVAYLRFSNWTILAFSILVGIGIEIAQSFIPNRGFSLGDLLADAMGAVMGVLVAVWVIHQSAIKQSNNREKVFD